jgi:hypothetical protein
MRYDAACSRRERRSRWRGGGDEKAPRRAVAVVPGCRRVTQAWPAGEDGAPHSRPTCARAGSGQLWLPDRRPNLRADYRQCCPPLRARGWRSETVRPGRSGLNDGLGQQERPHHGETSLQGHGIHLAEALFWLQSLTVQEASRTDHHAKGNSCSLAPSLRRSRLSRICQIKFEVCPPSTGGPETQAWGMVLQGSQECPPDPSRSHHQHVPPTSARDWSGGRRRTKARLRLVA